VLKGERKPKRWISERLRGLSSSTREGRGKGIGVVKEIYSRGGCAGQ